MKNEEYSVLTMDNYNHLKNFNDLNLLLQSIINNYVKCGNTYIKIWYLHYVDNMWFWSKFIFKTEK